MCLACSGTGKMWRAGDDYGKEREKEAAPRAYIYIAKSKLRGVMLDIVAPIQYVLSTCALDPRTLGMDGGR